MVYGFPLREPRPSDIEIFLAKPNRDIIAKIKHRMNPNHSIRLGQLNEITFTIPYDIEENHGIIRYPVVDQIMNRYHLKVVSFGQEEWYVIDKIIDTGDEKELKEIHAYSLGYELANKTIYQWAGVFKNNEYTKISLNAQEVLNNILSETIWSIDYIDAQFNVTYREFDFTNVTRLDAVFQIAETFGALIVWDTINRTISLYNLKNYGINRGLTFRDGRYLKSIKLEEKSDEMVTHFKAFGKDGLSLNRVNPTGTDFLVDYSYFLDKFATDELGNIISHSRFMTDGLCQAIITYQNKVNTYKGQFDTLLTQKETKQSELMELGNQLNDLETELIQIQDLIDVKSTSGQDYSLDLTNETDKKAEISAKETEITDKEAEITVIDNQIETIKTEISIEANFTQDQIIEKAQFEYERVWEDQNIYDDKILLERAIEEFEKLRSPKSIVEIDIVDFLSVEECKPDWDKFNIGDKCNIQHSKIGIEAESQMVEFNIDYDGHAISVVIADTVFGNTDEDSLAKYIYNSVSTSATVNLNKSKFGEITSLNNGLQAILEGKWNASKNEVVNSESEDVVVNRRGITITDKTDPLRFLRMTNGVIAMTNTGGNNYNIAITPEGIYGSSIIGKILAGQQLTIEASDSEGTKFFEVNGQKVSINGLALEITGGLPADQLNPDFKNSLVELNKDYTNGIRIDSTNGVVVTKSNNLVQTLLNATDGIKIQSRVSTTGSWVDKFYVDTNGNLQTKDIVADNITINSGYLDLDSINFSGTISGNNIDASTLTVTNANITGTLTANKLNLNENLKGVNVGGKIIIDSQGNLEMNGGNINGATDINVNRAVSIGDTLFLNGASYSGGIRWQPIGSPSQQIYVDPQGGAFVIHNDIASIKFVADEVWAGDVRLDVPQVAVFG